MCACVPRIVHLNSQSSVIYNASNSKTKSSFTKRQGTGNATWISTTYSLHGADLYVGFVIAVRAKSVIETCIKGTVVNEWVRTTNIWSIYLIEILVCGRKLLWVLIQYARSFLQQIVSATIEGDGIRHLPRTKERVESRRNFPILPNTRFFHKWTSCASSPTCCDSCFGKVYLIPSRICKIGQSKRGYARRIRAIHFYNGVH